MLYKKAKFGWVVGLYKKRKNSQNKNFLGLRNIFGQKTNAFLSISEVNGAKTECSCTEYSFWQSRNILG